MDKYFLSLLNQKVERKYMLTTVPLDISTWQDSRLDAMGEGGKVKL